MDTLVVGPLDWLVPIRGAPTVIVQLAKMGAFE